MAATAAATGTRAATSDMGSNLTTLRAYYQRNLAECRSSARALRERAQTVHLGIRNSSKTPNNINKILAARRQRKAILRAATGYEMAEAAWKAAIGMLNAEFGTPGSQQAIRKSGFDMTK